MIVLRNGEESDAPQLAALFQRSRAALKFLPELHSPDEHLWFIRNVVLATEKVTIAEREGVMAGFLAERAECITQLYLEPGFRQLGIGTCLLNDAKSHHDELWLWCFAANIPARTFYEKQRFVAESFTDGAGNEEGLPDVLYRWRR